MTNFIKQGARHKVLGCPHCHGEPEFKVYASGDVLIACKRHPDVPVWLQGDDLAKAITDWNDSDDWARIGTIQTDARMLSTRPSFNVGARP